MNCVLVILGPTGAGKSRLALELAEALGGEIVNADSRQVYRYLDIGTAKPSPQDQARVPHHLTDIIDPDQDFSLALFQRLAYKTIEEVLSRKRLPILVGGTGQYIWAVVEGWQVPAVAPDLAFRKEMEAQAAREGYQALFQELQDLAPEAAKRIDPRNVRRVIRALEIARHGLPPRQKRAPPYAFAILGLTMSRQDLYARIDQRIDAMIGQG